MKTPVGIIKAVDELFKIRAERKVLEAQEAELADTIKTFMLEHDVTTLEGRKALAQLIMRDQKTIDPEAYFDALNGDVEKLLATVTIRIDTDKKNDRLGAKAFLGEEDIRLISSFTKSASLTVKKLEAIKPTSHDRFGLKTFNA